MITVDEKWFPNIDKAVDHAITKSLALGDDEHVQIRIRTDREPFNRLLPYNYELRVYHQGERVYFDDPERPNGYKDRRES